MKTIILAGILTASTLLAADINLKACTSCHGINFEKPALGKSKIVKDLTLEEIKTSLKGYKEGTYGGPMKGLMKGQLAKYEDTTLLAQAVYHNKP